MKYSLIQVSKIHTDGRIDGVWVQDFIGDLNDAIRCARATEQANSNRITVAVVPELNFSSPNYSLQINLRRLDER